MDDNFYGSEGSDTSVIELRYKTAKQRCRNYKRCLPFLSASVSNQYHILDGLTRSMKLIEVFAENGNWPFDVLMEIAEKNSASLPSKY